VFNNDFVPILLVDPDTDRILDANPAACSFYGYSHEYLLTRKIADISVAASTDLMREVPHQHPQGGHLFSKHRLSNGESREVEVYSAPLLSAGKRILCCIIHDVTGHRQVLEEKMLLASLVESSQDAVIGARLDGTIFSWNKGAEKLYGYSSEEAKGKHVSMVIPPEVSHEIIQNQETLRGGATIENLETIRLRKDGTRVEVSISISPVKNESGQIIGGSSITRDITDRKRMEMMLRIQRDLGIVLNSIQNANEAFNHILEIAFQTKVVDAGFVYTVDHERGCIQHVTHKGLTKPFVEQTSRFDLPTLPMQMVISGKPVYTHYTNVSGMMHPDCDAEGFRGMAIVPIRYVNRVIAALILGSHHYDVIPDYARRILEMVAIQLGGALVRIRSEEALLENEKKFRELVEGTNDVIVSVDKSGMITYASPQLKAYGYQPEDVISRSYMDFILEEDRERVIAEFQETITTGREFPTVLRLKEPNGAIHWLEEKGHVIRDMYGNISGLMGVLRDITDRKKAEMEILKAKKRYEDLVQNIPVGVYRNTPGPDGHFLEANPAIVRMFEADSKEEFLKHNVSDLYANREDRQKFSDKLMNTGELLDEELPLKTLKGREIWGSVTAAMKRDESGQIYFDGIVEDITERRRVRDRLERLNECFIRYGADPQQNIQQLVSLCGDIFKASSAFYNRLEGEQFHAVGCWNAPAGFTPKFDARGRICHDVILHGGGYTYIRNLPASDYAKTDPGLMNHPFSTYIGIGVKFGGGLRGTLCLLFREDYQPTDEDQRFFELISIALGTEEERLKSMEMRTLLHDLSLVLNSIGDIREAYEQVLRSILRTDEVDCGGIYDVNRHTGALELITAHGLSDEFIEKVSHIGIDSAQMNLVQQGKPFFGHYNQIAFMMDDVRRKENLKAMAVIPVRYGGRVVAVINAASHRYDSFSPHMQKTFAMVGVQCSGVVARLHAWRDLKNNMEHYQHLASAITDYRFTVTFRDGIAVETRHTPEVEKVTGYTPRDFVDNPFLWIQMVPEEDRGIVHEQIRMIMQEHKGIPALHRIIRKDGSIRCIQTVPVLTLDSDGQLLSYDGLVRDMTDLSCHPSQT